jgi:hypothetical protein
MLRDGPLPRPAHGIVEYLEVLAFIVVPLALFGPGTGAATATSIVVGVVLLVVAASTAGPTSLVNQVPVVAHVAMDYILAVFLIAAPFLFGFSGETEPLVFFLGLGIFHLLMTIATRFLPRGEGGGRRRGGGGGEPASPGEAPPAEAPARD